MNKRYQVFVSSTYADLKEERNKVMQTLMHLDCIPAGMELFPAIDQEQFEFIKKIIDDCDYYILIIGGRYGSLSEDGISYTEKEYDYAIKKRLKVLAFIHKNPDLIPLGKSEKDNLLREKLDIFRNKVCTNRIVKFWDTVDELPGLVALSLSMTIKSYPAVGWIRADTVTSPELYKQISELQQENIKLNTFVQSIESEISTNQNLAKLDAKYSFSGVHRRYSAYTKDYINTKWEVTVSWGDIFKSLSPYLMNYPSDTSVESMISNILYSWTKEAETSGMSNVNNQDFQTIKIQLKALGLVDIKYTKSTKGDMGLFWFLTKKGENLMMNLRSVRK